jgi:Undecaprenyl-phosphate glucose phosphotransferase
MTVQPTIAVPGTVSGTAHAHGPFAFSSAIIPGVVLGADLLAILVAAVASWVALPHIGIERIDSYVFCIAFLLFSVPILQARAGLYQIDAIMRPIGRSDCVVIAVVTAFLLFLTIAFSLKVSEDYSRLWMLLFGVGATVLVIGGRVIVCTIGGRLSRRGIIGRNVAVLGCGEQAQRFLRRAGTARLHFARIGGVFSPTPGPNTAQIEGQPVLGGPDELVAAARRGEIDDVVVAMPWQEETRLREIIANLRDLPVDIYISTDLIGYEMPLRPALGEFHRLPLFEVTRRPLAGWDSVAKRVEDLVLASLMLVLLLPLFAIVAVAIKLDSRGPVLFRQKRLGFNNQEFSIYKFRSMYHRPEAEPPPGQFEPQAKRDDPRVTRVGRFIRRTSIDELPQLLNVLEGSMSLVGPRPHALSHNLEFARQIRGYFARHKVKPGITGWAQVNGLRGETAVVGLMKERVRHDTYYAENWSVLFDLRILMMTIFVVLFQKSAY